MSGESFRLISQLQKPLRGSIRVPGDKSISHRGVLFAAMAQGSSVLEGVLDSQDVRSTIHAVSSLGAKVALEPSDDDGFSGIIEGWGKTGPRACKDYIDCGNSGTTARLLMGVLSSYPIEVGLTGDDSLLKRPMRRITEPLSLMGAQFSPANCHTLPLTVRGSDCLKAIDYTLPVASAQLKSALILAALRTEGISRIHEPVASRSHTELMLPQFGADINARDSYIEVLGPTELHACRIAVPGDPSSAAFLLCAAALIPASKICIEGVSLNGGRIGFAAALRQMGVCIHLNYRSSLGFEPVGDIEVAYTGQLHACDVAAKDIPSMIDEIPILALVASFAEGRSVFRKVSELRVKESDRVQAIIEGLQCMGVSAWYEDDNLYIEGNPRLRTIAPNAAFFDFHSKGDHRFAMAWAVAAMCLPGESRIFDFDCCRVSYPRFLHDIERLSS